MNRISGKILLLIFISGCLILLKSNDCAAFRCGNGLVTTGDTKGKVLIECGKPSFIEKAGSKKSSKIREDKQVKRGDRLTSHKQYKEVPQKTEKWYYNCGEKDFIYILTFENGVLQKEDTAGRGKGKSDCGGR